VSSFFFEGNLARPAGVSESDETVAKMTLSGVSAPHKKLTCRAIGAGRSRGLSAFTTHHQPAPRYVLLLSDSIDCTERTERDAEKRCVIFPVTN
jgi:hypothetical protein